MRKNIYTLLFCLMALTAVAQTTDAGWIEINPDLHLFKNKKWFFTPEIGYRSTNFEGSHQFMLRPHFGYKMNKHFSYELGASYVVSWSDFYATKHDLGLYQHESASTGSWNGFSLGMRVRLEEGLSMPVGGDNVFTARLRVRPHIKYNMPFLKSKSLYIQALLENHTYLANRDRLNDALWLAGRLGVSPTKRLRLIFEYNYSLTYKTGDTSYGNRFRLITYYNFL